MDHIHRTNNPTSLQTKFFASRIAARLLAPGILLIASCGGGSSPTVEPPPSTGWMQVTPGPAQIDGVSIAATCSGAPGTDTTYRFFVRRGTGKELMVFFGGGGACWDDESCSRPNTHSNPDDPSAYYFGEVLSRDDPATYMGLLSLSDPANPVRNWNMVYLPYCTGDLHAGSKTSTYVNPTTKKPFTIKHRGVENAQVAMAWVKSQFPDPNALLVTGSSAGGYGAVVHYPRIRRAYPGARASLLADALPGVMPPSFETIGTQRWNIQLDPAVYGAHPQASTTPGLVGKLAAHFPADRFSQYASAADMILISYYDDMANGINDVVQGTACQQWIDGTRADLVTSQAAAPNYRSYLAGGTSHAILGGTNRDTNGVPLFNRERSAAGVQFTDWVTSHLSASGAGWSNATCTDCATVPVCPY